MPLLKITDFIFESRVVLVKVLDIFFFLGGGEFMCHFYEHHGKIFNLRFFFLIFHALKLSHTEECHFIGLFLKNTLSAMLEQVSKFKMTERNLK